jgi:hypothetical protein
MNEDDLDLVRGGVRLTYVPPWAVRRLDRRRRRRLFADWLSLGDAFRESARAGDVHSYSFARRTPNDAGHP